MTFSTNRSNPALFSALFFLCFISGLSAQVPELVRDIRPGSSSGIPLYLAGDFSTEGATVGNIFYFTANNGVDGVELWRTDGTEQGTQMVKDINSGNTDSSPRRLTVFGDKLLFFANDGLHGYELWISDGTEAGTQMVKDVNNGAPHCIRLAYTLQEADGFVLNGIYYFAADADGQFSQLWRSDGTEQGTYLVKNVCPTCTANSGSTGWFTALGNTLYLIAEDDLWKSTGTDAGTTKVTDDANANAPKNPLLLRAEGGKLYFAAEGSSVVDVEPWVSNGTAAGTQRLKDIGSGNFSGSFPRFFTAYNNKVYFNADLTLWVTNGTANGTTQFSTLETYDFQYEYGDANNFFVANNLLLFNADEPGGTSQEYLYATDGTAANTVQIAATNDYGFGNIGLCQYQNKVYFWGEENGAKGIWATNGTAGGKVFYPFSFGAYAPDLWIAGDNLFFFMNSFDTDLGIEIYKLPLTAFTPLTFNLSQTESIDCAGQQTAALQVEVVSGVPPYQYQWSNPALQGPNPANLGAGTYTVTVTDSLLTAGTQTITITAPPALNGTVQTTPASGSASNGSATVTASGGIPPYSFTWNTGANTDSLTGVPAGNYSVTVADDNGCTKVLNATVQMTVSTSNPTDAYLNVFPTVGHGEIQVVWTGAALGDVRIEIADNQGVVRRRWNELPVSTLHIADLPAGVYWLQLSSEGMVAHKALVLVR